MIRKLLIIYNLPQERPQKVWCVAQLDEEYFARMERASTSC
jgi:hypothetical protein